MSLLLTTESGLEVLVREPRPSDDPYVMSTMVRTVCGIEGSRPPAYRDADRRTMNAVERELRRRWHDDTFLRAVATSTEDDDMIVGFVVGRPRLLTYLGVRSGLTGMGLATALVGLLDIVREVPAAVEFPTWDLQRDRPGHNFPIGILNSGHWRMTLVPWTPG